jgi:hypothetical protein
VSPELAQVSAYRVPWQIRFAPCRRESNCRLPRDRGRARYSCASSGLKAGHSPAACTIERHGNLVVHDQPIPVGLPEAAGGPDPHPARRRPVLQRAAEPAGSVPGCHVITRGDGHPSLSAGAESWLLPVRRNSHRECQARGLEERPGPAGRGRGWRRRARPSAPAVPARRAPGRDARCSRAASGPRTTWTAVAPGAVFTVRICATGQLSGPC